MGIRSPTAREEMSNNNQKTEDGQKPQSENEAVEHRNLSDTQLKAERVVQIFHPLVSVIEYMRFPQSKKKYISL